MKMTKLKTDLAKILTLLFLGLLSFGLVRQIRRLETQVINSSDYRLLPADVYRVFSVGFLPAVIDWQWLKAIQDSEIYHVAKDQRAPVFYVYQLLTELDPFFRQGYTVGAKILAIIRDDIPGSKLLLDRAYEFLKSELPKHSDDWKDRYWYPEWEIPFLLGYLHLFELNQLPESQKYFIEAATYKDAPMFLKNLAERLKRPEGKYEVGLRILNTLIDQQRRKEVGDESGGSEASETALKELLKKRDSIFVKEYLFHLNEKFRDFLQSKKKYRTLPSVPRQSLMIYFKEFMRREKLSSRDPMGGFLKLTPEGKIGTTTLLLPVLGLE